MLAVGHGCAGTRPTSRCAVEAQALFAGGPARRTAPDVAARGRVGDPRLRRRARAAAWPARRSAPSRSWSGRLRSAFAELDLDGDWPWPEETLTYENALLPHALIVGGRRLGDARLRSVGLHVLDWLIEVQTSRRGIFTPIGSDGWWTRGRSRSQFDQQPIEATAMILAAAAAYETTQDAGLSRDPRRRRTAWFLGDNDTGLAVADVVTGGCHDGLSEDQREREPGRRVDPHVADRARDDAPAAHATPWPRGSDAVHAPARPSWSESAHERPQAVGHLHPHPRNPIITVDQLPYRANSVFNPGAGLVGGETLLLIRVEDLRGISHLLAARSSDGVTDWRFDQTPLIAPEPDRHPEEIWGCEDPRLTWLPELDQWAIAYTAYSRRGPLVSLRHDPRLHARCASWARSCRPRTRTRRSSRAGSTGAGR